MGEPVNVHPRRGGLKKDSDSKTCDAGPSGSAYEDICLGECERVTKVRLGGVAYNLKVPMNNIQCVHLFQTTCDI